MKKLILSLSLLIVSCLVAKYSVAQIQPVAKWIFHIGPSISFGTKAIANNDAGLGLLGGVEKNIYKNVSVGAETGFTYLIGDKTYTVPGKNKAYTIPLLAEMKAYFLSQFYISPRAGVIYFIMNDQTNSHISLAYGIAGGFNLPKKSNRINISAGYTSFRYDKLQRGYATLAAAIIIN